MVGVILAAVVLTGALATAALSAESLTLLVIATPLVAYFGIRDVEVRLRRRPDQPFSVLNWDACGVVLAPLAILIPYGTAALMTALVTVGTNRVRPPRHKVMIDAYNGAVMGLSVLATGAAAATVLTTSHSPATYTAAAALGALVNEAVTFFLIVGLWLTSERLGGQSGDGDPKRLEAIQLVRLSAMFIPIVVAFAAAIVVSYVDGAYLATAVLTLVPVLVIETLRHFGRTSIALQNRDEDREGVLRLIVESAEEQRRRLAEELHDGPLQSVLASRLLIDDDTAKGSAAPEISGDRRLAEWLDRAATELRAVVRGLVPHVLSERGLEDAVRHDAEMLHGTVSHGVEVSFALDTPPRPSTEFLLYRLAHEGLINAVRHAHAARVTIDIREEDKCYLVRVRDDGRGIIDEEISSAWERGHLGIATLRERVAIVGGTFDVARCDGGGTELLAEVPMATVEDRPERASAAAKIATWWAGIPSWSGHEDAPTSRSDLSIPAQSPSERPTLDPRHQASRRSG
jgi:signal transduction histidine kinase